MSFWLERFGDLDLPLIEAEQDIGAVGTRTLYMDLPGGGAYDAYGDEVAPRGMYTLQATGEIGNLTTQSEMQTQFDALRAKRGRKDKLYARMDDGSVRWSYARLSNIPMRRGVDNVLYLLASLSFDVTSPVWYGARHGDGWLLDSGELLDHGLVLDEELGDTYTLSHTLPTTAYSSNLGTAAVDNAILTITAGAADVTSIHITSDDGAITQSDFTWTGTLPATESLIIDAGAQSISITTGADAYDGLVFNAGHVISGWLRLMPGDTTFEIDITSTTDATMTIAYSNGYE